MPVILKIIWIILIVQTFFSVFTTITIYGKGFYFMTIPLSGMMAIDFFFIMKVAMPIVMIIGMHQRYRWIWIYGLFYFLLIAANEFTAVFNVNDYLNKMMDQMPAVPEGISEEMYYSIMRWAMITSFITSSLFNLAILIILYFKRKYFIAVKHIDPPSEEEQQPQ